MSGPTTTNPETEVSFAASAPQTLLIGAETHAAHYLAVGAAGAQTKEVLAAYKLKVAEELGALVVRPRPNLPHPMSSYQKDVMPGGDGNGLFYHDPEEVAAWSMKEDPPYYATPQEAALARVTELEIAMLMSPLPGDEEVIASLRAEKLADIEFASVEVVFATEVNDVDIGKLPKIDPRELTKFKRWFAAEVAAREVEISGRPIEEYGLKEAAILAEYIAEATDNKSWVKVAKQMFTELKLQREELMRARQEDKLTEELRGLVDPQVSVARLNGRLEEYTLAA